MFKTDSQLSGFHPDQSGLVEKGIRDDKRKTRKPKVPGKGSRGNNPDGKTKNGGFWIPLGIVDQGISHIRKPMEKHICIKPGRIWWQGDPTQIRVGETILATKISIPPTAPGENKTIAYSVRYSNFDHPFGISEAELKRHFIPISEWRDGLIDEIIR